MFAAATSGTLSTAYTSSTELKWNTSTGDQSAPQQVASNGFFVNPTTNTVSYTIPSNFNAVTAGKFTVATSTTITVSTGSRWVIV